MNHNVNVGTVSAEKESKITSTLRRLSVVRRKSKNKLRHKADKPIEEAAEGITGKGGAATVNGSCLHVCQLLPQSHFLSKITLKLV